MKTTNKHIFVISDLEMGKKDQMDDFCDDDALVKFLKFIGAFTVSKPVTLVLNGDIFDFLKMDHRGKYSRYITEEISLWKLEQILQAHASVFEAMRDFVNHPMVKIIFVIGNHDADLVWPALQKKLRLVLNQNERVEFTFHFDEETLHIEHGNLVDPFFAFDWRKPIIRYRGEAILNLPIGSQIVSQHLVPVKKKFHREERLYPRSAAFSHSPEFEQEIKNLLYHQSWRVFLIEPLLHLGDPTYRIPYISILKFVFRHGISFICDEAFLDLKKLIKAHSFAKFFVLSHTHAIKTFHFRKRRILITDTWRNEYNLLTKRKKEHTYAEISIKNGQIESMELKVFSAEKERGHKKIQQDPVTYSTAKLGV